LHESTLERDIFSHAFEAMTNAFCFVARHPMEKLCICNITNEVLMARAANNKTRGSDTVKVNWKLVHLRQKMYFVKNEIFHY